MKPYDRLERELSAWFVDTAAPRTPDYTDDILRQTARVGQRPRWSFPERWFPRSVMDVARRTSGPVAWRTIGLLAMLGLLLAVAIAAFVGSQPRLPAPFGRAANGLVAYDNGGDIFIVDPITGTRQPIVIGPEIDTDPRFSLDGTRLVFMRAVRRGVVPVLADAGGGHQLVTDADPLFWFDPESLAWSPDGRLITFTANLGGSPAIYIINAIDGKVRPLEVDYLEGTLWRPPSGRELLFHGGNPSAPGLFLMSLDDGAVTTLTLPSGDRSDLRPYGWTPDGNRLVFRQGDVTRILDIATGDSTIIDVDYPQLSNDGSRVVGLDGDETGTWLCVARIDGGPCLRISETYAGSWDTGYRWSPNDEWILTTRVDDAVFLLDPDGGTPTQPPWLSDGAESWQRRAP